MSWRPFLPEPQPAEVIEPGDPEPVPLDVLRDARDLCANFPVPPRQFRRRTTRKAAGSYSPSSDIVAVDPAKAAMDGMGGEDGYYAVLVHELLHATGHPSRLDRATVSDFSLEGNALEEGTVIEALRIVLARIAFPAEALDWHAPLLKFEESSGIWKPLPVDERAAREAAAWLLRTAS